MGWWTFFTLGMAAVLILRRRRRVKPPGWRFVPMSLYVGVPGSGKSYRLTWGAIRSLAQGRHVRLNFRLRPDRVYIALCLRYGLTHADAMAAVRRIAYVHTFDDIIDAYDCDMYLDEAQDLLNSQDWGIFPQPVITWFAQHRHRRCTVTLASHRFSSIHAYLRDGLIARIYLTRPAFWLIAWWHRIVLADAYPVLQFVQIKDEDEEVLSKPSQRRGGFLRGFMTMNRAVLDPVFASCYDHEGGVLPSPLAELRRRKARDEGLELSARIVRAPESSAVDGLPYRSVDDVLHARAWPGPGWLSN